MWLVSGGVCQGQKPQNDPPVWQTDLLRRYASQRSQTLRLARQQGWPLRKNHSNGRQFVLQAFDSRGNPIYYTLHNREAAEATRTESLYAGGSLGLALSGSNPALTGRLGLWDGGRVLTTHQEFSGSTTIQQRDNGAALSDHATHLAGTLVARGVNPLARGMAFGAQLSVWNYADDLSEIAVAAPTLLLSNHAYGPVVGWVYNPDRPGNDPNLKWEWWGNTSVSSSEDYLFGFYTTKTRDLDRIAYNNPFYLMVRSADNKRAETGPPAGTPYFLKNTSEKSTLPRSRNNGYDVIPAEATAKNVLTVGAAEVVPDAQNQPLTIQSTAYSGWGPTDDGRIKPDLLGLGTTVFSTLASSPSAYGTYTGTSMASANITGSLFLLQELYAQQRLPASPPASDPIGSGLFMRSATLRGLAIHSADRTNPATGPTYREGWGLLNMERAARVVLNKDQGHQILERTLEPGGTFTQRIVAQGNEPLVVTLTWTDPEGAATAISPGNVNNRSARLVNDLDVQLTDGRWTSLPFVLDPAHPERTATPGNNTRDNVEQVYIANPVAGQSYTLLVSHKGKMTYNGQPFSLIISGLRRAVCPFGVTISPSRDTTLCVGASLVLRSSERPGAVYQWLRDGVPLASANAPTIAIAQAGAYAMRFTDISGCTATSPAVQVSLRALTARIVPGNTQWLCQRGQSVQLTAVVPTNTNFEWLRDGVVLSTAQSTTLTTDQPGNYQVRLSHEGCDALSDSVSLRMTTVNDIDVTPAETNLLLIPGATVTLRAPAGIDYRYQWYQNNKAVANTNDRLAVSQSGTYKVKITQQNCVGWSTERHVRTSVLTALSSEPDSVCVVYPNPAEQVLFVRYARSGTKTVWVSILNQQGQPVGPSLALTYRNQQFEGTLNVSNLPAGAYFVHFSDGDRTRVVRFLKK